MTIIGIDLGTRNSAGAYIKNGVVTVVPSKEGFTIGGKSFPSYIAFDVDGNRLVGEPARAIAALRPESTASAFKRLMGTSQKIELVVKGQKRSFTPEELSAMLLQKIKEDTEEYLGEKVTEAIITVPAYFNGDQREATKNAGRIAGLDVKRLINEPTAAAIAYGLDKKKSEKILVFDFGAGTLDVTLMEMEDGVFEVSSTHGDTHLGGTDMDQRLYEKIRERFKAKTGFDVEKDAKARQRLLEATEQAKIELSSKNQTTMNIPFLTMTKDGSPLHLTEDVYRSDLEEMIQPVLDRCIPIIEAVFKESKTGIKREDLTSIILVGGPTKMPIVRELVRKHVGTCIKTGIDPMECVARGAATYAGVLGGEVKDILLLDVCPLSLGIETLGGISTTIIERNTTVPVKKSKIFSTAEDNQTAVTINVLEGERQFASDNIPLNRFDLTGIDPAPRGIPQIEVSFDVDANSMLTVTAKDLKTGKEQTVQVRNAKKLSESEIQRMIQEAEANKEQDLKRRDEINLINESKSYVSMARQAKDKAQENERQRLDEFIESTEKAIEAKDFEKLREQNTQIRTLIDTIDRAAEERARTKESGSDQTTQQGSNTEATDFEVKDIKK